MEGDQLCVFWSASNWWYQLYWLGQISKDRLHCSLRRTSGAEGIICFLHVTLHCIHLLDWENRRLVHKHLHRRRHIHSMLWITADNFWTS
jgi:hypothetical protein